MCQLHADDEVIVSDDQSTDETVDLIKAFADPRIRLLERSTAPRSPVSNFDCTLAHARHNFIFLADQDDIWHRDKITTVVQLLQSFDLVVSDCTLIDEEGIEIAPSFFAQHHSRPGFWANFIRNSYLGCCMAFRRTLLENARPIPPSVPMHDIWLGLVAEWYGQTCFYPEQLVAYRRHNGAASTAAGRSSYSLWQKIMLRYQLLRSLMQRIFEQRR